MNDTTLNTIHINRHSAPHARCTAAFALIVQGGLLAEQGVKQLFEILWHRFVHYFVCMGQALPEAEDLASTSFEKILSNLHTLKDATALLAWAHVVARRTLYSHIRRTTRQGRHEIQLDDDELEAACFDLASKYGEYGCMNAITQRCIQKQYDKFVSQHPERALWLERSILENEPLDLLSQALGRTAGATREYLSQCRKRLEKYLQECLL